MIIIGLWLGVGGCLLLGFMVGHGVGFAAGFAEAMKKNGWHRVLNGWHKET